MFPALRSYGCNLSRFAVRVPNWHRTATTPAMGAVCFSGLGSSDLAHGVVEGQAEDLSSEVQGIAGQIALWPTPIGVFDDQTGIGPLRVATAAAASPCPAARREATSCL